MRVTRLTIRAAIVLSIPFSPLDGSTAVRQVPGDYGTIQGAVVASAPGDSILVSPGLYFENVDTGGKRIALLGSGAEVTLIDGGMAGPVLNVSGGGGLIQDFTLRNGRSPLGGGIQAANATHLVIRNNVLEDNTAGLTFDTGFGGGIYGSNVTDLTIESNLIRRNTSRYVGGGIFVTCPVGCVVADNRIESNHSYVAGAGLYASGYARISRNVLANNISDNFAAGVYVEGAGPLTQNTIVDNLNGTGTHIAAGIDARNGGLDLVIERNIVAFNRGVGIIVGAGRSECNDSWGNTGAAYEFWAEADTTNGRNLSLDPIFCSPTRTTLTISEASPCAPQGSSGCGLIGAVPTGCSITTVARRSWGQVKVRYR